MQAPDALVPLEGACNFRDLGGYPTVDGRRTRSGRLYRSDGLQELSTRDIDTLRRHRLRTVVDLRTPEEVARFGRGPLAGEPVRYEHVTVIRTDAGESLAAPVTDDLAERYLWYLEVGRQAMVRALELAGDASAQPLVFHCAAGKDRTGVLAALILACVGVTDDAIVADYARTAEVLGPILERLTERADPEQVRAVPPSRLTVEAATMERFLVRLRARHGGAEAWARAAGADPERLAGLRATLLAPR